MAILNFNGFESADDSEGAQAGTVSYSTSVIRAGSASAYSLRVNPTTSNLGRVLLKGLDSAGQYVDYSAAQVWISFMFRVDTLPAANSEEIMRCRTGGGSLKFALRINSTGTISAYDRTNSLLGTGSTTLSTSTWYQIDATCTSDASAATWEFRVNRSVDASGSGAATLAAAHGQVAIGKIFDNNSQTIDCYFDDVVISDSGYTDLSSTYVAMAIPNANGSTMQWTSGTGSSDYQEVDERPPDTATYLLSNGSANQLALLGYQSLSDLSISGATVRAVKPMANVRENAAGTSSNLMRLKSGATNSDSGTVNQGTGVTTTAMLFATDPNTGSAWTGTAFDAVEAGLLENNAVAIRMTWTGLGVLYSPAVVGNTQGILPALMGMI